MSTWASNLSAQNVTYHIFFCISHQNGSIDSAPHHGMHMSELESHRLDWEAYMYTSVRLGEVRSTANVWGRTWLNTLLGKQECLEKA